MDKISNVSVGVDVSKKMLDVYLHPVSKKFRVANNLKGTKKLLEVLSEYDVCEIVCEASGGYETLLAKEAAESNYNMRIENPRKIRHFAEASGIRSKTDAIDAKMIATFAATLPRSYEQTKRPILQLKLKELVKYKNNLKGTVTEERLRLQNPTYHYAVSYIKRHITQMEKTVAKVNKEIADLVNQIDEIKAKKELMETMPGVGCETSTALAAEMPELGTINEKKIASLLGVAPFTKESGNYKGVARIRDGRPAPRKAVYMAALTASRYNPIFKVFYERLIKRGKAPKVALVAVMRKMIVTLNAMLRDNAVWDPQKNCFDA